MTRPKGIDTDIIPLYEQETMFQAWCERQTYAYVQQETGKAYITVKRYKTKNKWDERLQKIEAAVRSKVDGNIAEVKAESIKDLHQIRLKAKKSALAGKFKHSKDAAQIYMEATKMELALRGDVIDKSVTLLIIAQERWRKRLNKAKEGRVEIPAKDVKILDVDPIKEAPGSTQADTGGQEKQKKDKDTTDTGGDQG